MALLDLMRGEESRHAPQAGARDLLACLLAHPEGLLDGSSPELHAAVLHALLAGNFTGNEGGDSSLRGLPPISPALLTPAEVSDRG